MQEAKYLVLDTETGGVDTDYTLLTSYLSVLDADLMPITALDLKLKPNRGSYILDAAALRVNGINIGQHDLTAIKCEDAKPQLYNFLKEWSKEGKTKLIPIGHNVAFDIKFVQANILSKKNWDEFVSYRTLDTGCVAQFLIASGVIDGAKTTGSMESLAKYFGVDAAYIGFPEAKLHNAEYDSKLTVAVLRKMQEAMKNHYTVQAIVT